MTQSEKKNVLISVMKNGQLRIIGAVEIDINDIPADILQTGRNKKSKIQMIFEPLKEFCAETTVHGIRFFTERNRHWTERLWWVISISMSVALCSIAVQNIWLKWQEQPVNLSFNDKTTSIEIIPFPAVTVCSTQKLSNLTTPSRERVEYLENLLTKLFMIFWDPTREINLTPNELNKIDVIGQICLKLPEMLPINFVYSRTEPIYKTIRDEGPEVDKVVRDARFGKGYNMEFKRTDEWRPIFTEHGLCYTLNSLNSREMFTDDINPELMTVENNPTAINWNREDGYRSNVNENELYPYRMFGCHSSDTLFVELRVAVDRMHESCDEKAQGFRIMLHSPDELPIFENSFFVPFNKMFYISLKPHMITASKNLRSYSPEKRGCFFGTERQLRFFRSYSQQKCEMECLANYTKQQCGCVTFSMTGDKDTRICTIVDAFCYVTTDSQFSRHHVVRKCNCLPDCTSITYDADIYHTQKTFVSRDLPETGFAATSHLSISFKQPQFIALKRSESSTMTDFVASCGGLLGLFMGISMLSIIELIYYFTLRLFCTLKRRNTIEDSGVTWSRSSESNQNAAINQNNWFN